MKYFAVAVIFGLFAISQALPVEESREKRFIDFKGILKKAVGLAGRFCDKSHTPGSYLEHACDCFKSVKDVIGMFGDESVTDDENDEEKRFINSAIAKQVLQFVTERVNDACDNPPEGFQNICSCAKKTIALG